MGQTLSSPATDKKHESGGDDRFLYGLAEMQGWRITMEDSHTTQLQLDDDKKTRNAFFAVYDGHGGATVAKYAGLNVYKRLAQEPAYAEKNYREALKRAFLGTDEDILKDPAFIRDPSGCTAVAALVTGDNKIFVANAGDSRSVISIKGEVKPLSYDHKPTNESEKTRIVNAGGYVEYGRVNGNLALARALGDFEYKKNPKISAEAQIITCDPEIIEHDITEEDEFFIVACDGIWDCLTSQQCVDVVRLLISQGKELSEVGEIICEHCLAPDTASGAGIGCDNMTILIVAILNGRTKEEWYSWITDRVKQNYGHTTPDALPQLYSQSRLMAFRARRQAEETREKERQERQSSGGMLVGSSGFGGGITRILGSSGGISFHPGGSIMSDTGTLMFDQEDSDDDDSDDDMDVEGSSRAFFSHTFGFKRETPDVTKSLKEQLDELDRDSGEEKDAEGGASIVEVDGLESGHVDGTSPDTEAPPPPKRLPNGDSKEANPPQLTSKPGPDEPRPAVKAEGLLDHSEDPLNG
jgi:protein phosphatase 2C family protein 2/3